jgi:hypothetical protein
MRPVARRLAPSLVAAAALSMLASEARGHCDTVSGPVVAAARTALEKGNIQPVLKWVKPEAEPEISAAFARAIAVRSQGGTARELADHYFLETTVRLHRAGEGAPYSGLKTDVDDPGGVIAASDRALDSGSVDDLVRHINERAATGLRERHARVVEARKEADRNVAAGRAYVQAYVEYVHFAENLARLLAAGGHQAAPTGHQHGQ